MDGPEPFYWLGAPVAVYGQFEQMFNPDRKDHHWGKRKLKRDM
jgi:hypothetical protein